MLTKKQLLGIATLIGGTLGAWLFGVPYVFAQAWVLQWTLWTIFIGICVIVLNLLQAEVSLTMPWTMRLAELMRTLLPHKRGFVWVFVTCMQFFIAMFAYVSLIWAFFTILLGPHYSISPAITATLYSVFIGFFLYKWTTSIERYDKKIVALFLGMLLFVIIYGFSISTPTHYLINHATQRFLPYGVLIYCLNSVTSIPLIESLLWREKKDLPYIIVIGGIICMSIALLWWWSIVGISGMATSPDALSGLENFLPTWLVRITGLVWILALISPHLIIGEHMKETLQQTFRFHTIDARTTVVVLPLLAYLYIQSDFVETIGFSWAIFTWMTCILVGCMNLILHHKKRKTETYILPYNTFFSYLIIVIFSWGIIYECIKAFIL